MIEFLPSLRKPYNVYGGFLSAGGQVSSRRGGARRRRRRQNFRRQTGAEFQPPRARYGRVKPLDARADVIYIPAVSIEVTESATRVETPRAHRAPDTPVSCVILLRLLLFVPRDLAASLSSSLSFSGCSSGRVHFARARFFLSSFLFFFQTWTATLFARLSRKAANYPT